MNPWTCKRYQSYHNHLCKGISLRFEPGIDTDLRLLFLDFTKWLRENYVFPIHVNVYVKNCEKVKLINGKLAYGAFRWFGLEDEPYIRIAAKPDSVTMSRYSVQEVYESILSSFVHELTHYFQWVNRFTQTDRSSEWQANYYRYRIIECYYKQKQ